jgi:ribonucleotide monophosphatase NagD (HAD superfamily)
MVEEDISYLFLTNVSTYTPLDVVVKLRKFGIETSGSIVVGDGGLLTALNDSHCAISGHSPDYVIAGEGRVLNDEL